jgi:transposase
VGQYVAIDLHKRRSLIVRADDHGERLETVRIENNPLNLAQVISGAGEDPEVVLEATCGWYWAADVLAEMRANIHLAHPLGLHWDTRRVKNDMRDANALLDMLRLDVVPEAWIAPPPVRELRELVRYRAKLVMLRSSLTSQVQGVLTKEGVISSRYLPWGPKGRQFLDALPLSPSYRTRIESLCRLIDAYDAEVKSVGVEIAGWLDDDLGYQAVQSIKGVGPILAAVFVAEIGRVDRFSDPHKLCSWAGLTPRHRESDLKVTRGGITKQGSRLVRWAAIEAISRARDTSVAELYALRSRATTRPRCSPPLPPEPSPPTAIRATSSWTRLPALAPRLSRRSISDVTPSGSSTRMSGRAGPTQPGPRQGAGSDRARRSRLWRCSSFAGVIDASARGLVAMVLTSPPYGPSQHGRVNAQPGKGVFSRTTDSKDPANLAHVVLAGLLEAMGTVFTGFARVLRPGGIVAMTVRPWWRNGQLIDLPGALVRRARNPALSSAKAMWRYSLGCVTSAWSRGRLSLPSRRSAKPDLPVCPGSLSPTKTSSFGNWTGQRSPRTQPPRTPPPKTAHRPAPDCVDSDGHPPLTSGDQSGGDFDDPGTCNRS